MPPTTSRHASMSSVSSFGEPQVKKFACLFEGCLKSFSRSEHLHRHSLNHKEGTNTCQRCSAHFRRRDLLDRHMVRHKEKDDEAGGEGLGHLATRKRLWRDAAGNIINGRRPFQTPGTRRNTKTNPSSMLEDKSVKTMATSTAPRRIPGRARVRHVNRKEPPPELTETEEPTRIAEADQAEFMESNNWTMRTDEDTFISTNLSYENIKQEPDFTYNSPSNAMNYYGWLFEQDSTKNTQNYSSGSLTPNENHPYLDSSCAYSSSYASSSDSYSECVSPTSLNPNLLSRNNSISFDAFLPLSILADGAAAMRRHTFVENLPQSHSPPLQEKPRRESHATNFSARMQKPVFDYDGSSLFADSALPDMYHSRNTSTVSSRLSSPLHTPSLSASGFDLCPGKKFENESVILSHNIGDATLSELMSI